MHSPDVTGLTGRPVARRRFAKDPGAKDPVTKGPVAKGNGAKDRFAKDQAASARRRAAATLDADASMLPPLQWWRHLPAETFTADRLGVLRRAVAGIGMVGEPRWADAVRGHAAAAVGVARRVMQERRPLVPIVDLTMSTVLIAAVTAGDPDAITVLVTMIARMGGTAEKDALTRSWLNRQRKPQRHDRLAISGMRARIGSGD
jgi:hypothetical protein